MYWILLDFLLSRQWDLRWIGRGLGWTDGGFGMDGWTDLYHFNISLYVLYHFYNYFPPSLPTYLPAYLPTYPRTYLPTCLPA